jgi:hypothetical protein
VVVELFQRHHRQVDVVLLETEQRRWVMHQHIGVEHEHLGDAALVGLAAGGRLDHRLDRLVLGRMRRGAVVLGLFPGARDRRFCRRGGRLGPGARSFWGRHGLAADQVLDRIEGRRGSRHRPHRTLAGRGLGVVFCQQQRGWLGGEFWQGHQGLNLKSSEGQ